MAIAWYEILITFTGKTREHAIPVDDFADNVWESFCLDQFPNKCLDPILGLSETPKGREIYSIWKTIIINAGKETFKKWVLENSLSLRFVEQGCICFHSLENEAELRDSLEMTSRRFATYKLVKLYEFTKEAENARERARRAPIIARAAVVFLFNRRICNSRKNGRRPVTIGSNQTVRSYLSCLKHVRRIRNGCKFF